MEKKEVLLPHRYNVYMQDLDKEHIELIFLGFVNTIGEARGMVNAFREAFSREKKNATVFFQHAEIAK